MANFLFFICHPLSYKGIVHEELISLIPYSVYHDDSG